MDYQKAMAELNRLRELIKGGGGDSVFTEEDRAIIAALHLSELGEPLRNCSCKNLYTDAVIEIYHQLKMQKNMASSRKYQLKAGVIAWIGTECYNRHTLTDALAKKYLALHPDARNLFDRIPEAGCHENKNKENQ